MISPAARATALLLMLGLAAAAGSAGAEQADRDHPVNLEADRVAIDDARKVHVFEGNVRLTQGSLSIEAERIVVSQDPAGFQRGSAEGGPARFEQKREGRDETVSGQATRIEYDARSERVEFFGNAVVRSGPDEIRGEYIGYDAREERYFAESRAPDSAGPASGRVRATIQPRRENPAPKDSSPSALPLQPATSIVSPPASKEKGK